MMFLHASAEERGQSGSDIDTGRDKARDLLLEYSTVFQDVPAGLPPDRGTGHTI